MNDQRAPSQPPGREFDSGELQRDWLRRATRSTDPFADPCLLIAAGVDTDVQTLELIVGMAGAASVHTITDARTVVDECVDVRPGLVVIDLDMPHVDGRELLTAVRSVLADEGFLAVIALTGDTTTTARELALAAGVHDVVTKPFDHVELVRRVRNLLAMRALDQDVRRHNRELRAGLDSHG